MYGVTEMQDGLAGVAGPGVDKFSYRVAVTVPANGGATTQLKLDSGSDFIVEQLAGTVKLNAAADAAIANTALPHTGSNNDATGNNDLPSMMNVRMSMTNSGRVFQNQPIEMGLICGNGADPNLPITRHRFEQSDTISLEFENDTSYAVTAVVVFEGVKVKPRR